VPWRLPRLHGTTGRSYFVAGAAFGAVTAACFLWRRCRAGFLASAKFCESAFGLIAGTAAEGVAGALFAGTSASAGALSKPMAKRETAILVIVERPPWAGDTPGTWAGLLGTAALAGYVGGMSNRTIVRVFS